MAKKTEIMKNRLKKTVCALVLMATGICSQAQFNIRGGIAGGAVTGPVRLEDVGNSFTNVISGNDINGFEAGLMLKAEIGPVYLKPMAMYGFRYGSVTYTTSVDYSQQTTNFTMNKVELPVLVGLHFLGPFYVEAGPSYNYIFNATNKYSGNDVQITQSAIGYRVGVGAELGPLTLGLSYGGASYSTTNSRATFKEPYKLIFGIGILFGGDLDKDPPRSVRE